MKKLSLIVLFVFMLLIVSACKDKEYTITFINDEEEVIETLSVESLKDVLFPTLTKDRYEFKGWQTAENVLITENDSLDSDLTLYPIWEDVIISVHHLDGEIIQLNMTTDDIATSIFDWYYPGDQIGFFIGYFDENDVLFDDEFPLTKSTSVYPKFATIEEYLLGESYGDDFFGLEGFLSEYYYNTNQLKDDQGDLIVNENAVEPYEHFEIYLESIGEENFDEEAFITFFAQDLINHNPPIYKNLQTGDTFLVDAIEQSTLTEIHYYGSYGYYIDENQNFYIKKSSINNLEVTYTYVKVNIVTDEQDINDVLTSDDTLTPIIKTGKIIKVQDKYLMEYSVDNQMKYIDIFSLEIMEQNPHLYMLVPIKGLLFKQGQTLYEYIEPMSIVKGDYVQYQATPFVDQFRQYIYNTYSRAFNQYTDDDFNRLLNLIILEMHPELFTTLPSSSILDYHQAMKAMFVGDITYSLQNIHFYISFYGLGTISQLETE